MTKGIVTALVIVSIPRLAYVNENLQELYSGYLKKIFTSLMAILLPIACGLFMMSQQVITILGGIEYKIGATSLKILCIAIVFSIIGSFFVNCVLIVKKMEMYVLVATVIAAVLNVSLNFLLLPELGIEGAAITTVLAELFACVVEGYYVKKEIREVIISYKSVVVYLFGCVGIVFMCIIGNILFDNIYMQTGISGLGSVCVYSIILILFKDPLVGEIIAIFKRLRKLA